jgi:ABC-type uncharacterized transport system auxiliary subunit
MIEFLTSQFEKFAHSRRTPGAVFLAAAHVACLLFLTGCLSRPALKTETFSFGIPAVEDTNAAAAPVLSIKKITVAAPFGGRPLVYRTGEFTYEHDPYAEFLDFPEKELVAPLRAGLGSQGDFRSVVLAGDVLEPDIMVEINVSQLFGDFREQSNARAILRAQFIFCQETNGIASGMIFQKEYSQDIPLKKPTAAALMAGWNRALDEIIGKVLTDYRQRKN